MANADLTILIVAYRSAATLPRVSAALAAQTLAPSRILVLENGSPDADRVQERHLPPGATLVTSESNLGFAQGNNRLAAMANTEWLALLNPDAYPDPDWIERLMAGAHACPQADIFGSTQWADDGRTRLDGAGDVWHALGMAYRGGHGSAGPPPATGESFAACGAAMMIRRSLFERLGGFDADFFCYMEDVDLCYRARLQGARVVQLADAHVVHQGGASSDAAGLFAFRHGARNRIWTLLKCTPAVWLTLLAPFMLAATALLWLFAARQGRAGEFAQAMAQALRGAPRIWSKRRATQRSNSRPAKISALWAWSPGALKRRDPRVVPLSDAQSPRGVDARLRGD